MSLIKILGLGSPFGEDRVGWIVATLLKNKITHPSIVIECHDRPGVRLLELMKQATNVFLVDAVKSENQIGTIHRLTNNEIYESNHLLSTHDVGVAQTLQLGQALNILPESIVLYGIEIDNLQLNACISDRVDKAINQVILHLRCEINTLLQQI